MDQEPLNPVEELGLEPQQLPRHIAIIMDGNGRWANLKGLPRINGHMEGAANVRNIIIHCARLKIEILTLYSFSAENWKRPKDEVEALMDLYVEYLIKERTEIIENNVRLIQIGRRDGLPAAVLRELDTTVHMSKDNTGLKLYLAINYSSRNEIVDACRFLAREVEAGRLTPDQIDAQQINNALYTAGIPDPDLLIRTAGEMRISNFLLWQISYSELFVTEVLWPDFRKEHINEAICTYAERERRFGGVKSDIHSNDK
ncbi:MAG: isoprenyl transferase [Planctomycetota bacterium]|nr:MAG: isoprenyl transferase [Planctomycetota bacterium]